MSSASISRHQLDRTVLRAYLRHADLPLSNTELYADVAHQHRLPSSALTTTRPVGKTGQRHNPFRHAVRWSQQTLKALGLLDRLDDRRGLWALSDPLHRTLHRARAGVRLVAMSTELGLAIWASHHEVFPFLREPITLCLTSPPYPLRKPRAYGNPKTGEYVDFICRALEPIIKQLVPEGSLCLNLSNDIFLPGSPARALYREQLLLTLCERFGLFKMDEIIWVNPAKPPGPTEWASKRCVQLQTTYEVIYWLARCPARVKADNRRVRLPHSARHEAFVAGGGEHSSRTSNDGAYAVRPGSFSRLSSGRIPRNVLTMSHTCVESHQYQESARQLGVPLHGAVQPIALSRFLIEFLTEPGDLVVDPYGGTLTSGLASQQLNRSWLVCEWILEYIQAGAERFRPYPGFQLHPTLS